MVEAAVIKRAKASEVANAARKVRLMMLCDAQCRMGCLWITGISRGMIVALMCYVLAVLVHKSSVSVTVLLFAAVAPPFYTASLDSE